MMSCMSVNVEKLGATKGARSPASCGEATVAALPVPFPSATRSSAATKSSSSFSSGCVDLAVAGLVTLLELEHDGLGRVASLDPLPHLDRSSLQAEVMTAGTG